MLWRLTGRESLARLATCVMGSILFWFSDESSTTVAVKCPFPTLVAMWNRPHHRARRRERCCSGGGVGAPSLNQIDGPDEEFWSRALPPCACYARHKWTWNSAKITIVLSHIWSPSTTPWLVPGQRNRFALVRKKLDLLLFLWVYVRGYDLY